jgi:hypothetical protein
VTWVLPSGRQVREDPGLADLGEAGRQPVGEPDRERHEIFGLVAGVAEHHALVAGALAVEHVLAGEPVRVSIARVDALAMSGLWGRSR